MEEQIQQHGDEAPRESTFAGLLVLARTHAGKLLICAVAGAVMGWFACYFLPTEWRATAVVQLGRVMHRDQSVPVEPIADAIERVMLRGFQHDALAPLNINLDSQQDSRGQLFRKTVFAASMTGDIIELSVRGYSKEDAVQELTALADHLVLVHQKIIGPSIQRLNDELSQVDTLLAQTQARQDELQKEVRQRARAGGPTSDLLIPEIIHTNDEELNTLLSRRSALLEQSNPQVTFNTRSVGPIFVGDRPALPRKVPVVFAGCLIGIAIAVGWVALAGDRRRRVAAKR